MIDQAMAYGIWTGLVVLIAGAIVLSWPYRRTRGFVLRRLIAASREEIWDAYQPSADSEAHAAVHPNIVSSTLVGTSPRIWEQVIDLSGGHGTHLATARIESVVEQRPERSEFRGIDMDGGSRLKNLPRWPMTAVVQVSRTPGTA